MTYTKIIAPPETERIKSGRVILKPDEEVGEHVTENKEEIIIVLKGTATIIKENKNINNNAIEEKNSKNLNIKINEGQTYYISKNLKHNVRNDGETDLEYIYVVALLNKA